MAEPGASGRSRRGGACGGEAAEHQTGLRSNSQEPGRGDALQKRKLVQRENEILENKRAQAPPCTGGVPTAASTPAGAPQDAPRAPCARPPVPGPPHSGPRGPLVPPGLGLGRQLGVAGRGQLALQVLEDVEREAADHGDSRHLPHEGHRGDEGHVCRGETQEGVRGRQAGREAAGPTSCAPPGGGPSRVLALPVHQGRRTLPRRTVRPQPQGALTCPDRWAHLPGEAGVAARQGHHRPSFLSLGHGGTAAPWGPACAPAGAAA